MRIHFQDKREAARFATAVVNVTGREPIMARTDTPSWRVQSSDLNRELAFAILSLLQSGTPCHQVTLDQVADQVEAGRRELHWAPAERARQEPAARPMTPAELTVLRERMRQELAIAAR